MDKKPYPSETQERFIVRLPDGMRDRIADAAKAAGRSMNAEIVHRLEASFNQVEASSEKDSQAAMLYEMRKTQLHLELNTTSHQISEFFAVEKYLLKLREDGKMDSAEVKKKINRLQIERENLEQNKADLLGMLAELDRTKPKP